MVRTSFFKLFLGKISWNNVYPLLYEPHHENLCPWGFRLGQSKPGLCTHRRQLETWKQLTVMCTTRGEHWLLSIRCHKECEESKFAISRRIMHTLINYIMWLKSYEHFHLLTTEGQMKGAMDRWTETCTTIILHNCGSYITVVTLNRCYTGTPESFSE